MVVTHYVKFFHNGILMSLLLVSETINKELCREFPITVSGFLLYFFFLIFAL